MADLFLQQVLDELKNRASEIPTCRLWPKINKPVSWGGLPENWCQKADIWIDSNFCRIIVEIDEKGAWPDHSIVKYWPYLVEHPNEKLFLIEVWKRSDAVGQGYFELAKFIGNQFHIAFSSFEYIPIALSAGSSLQAKEIAGILLSEIKKLTST